MKVIFCNNLPVHRVSCYSIGGKLMQFVNYFKIHYEQGNTNYCFLL